MSRRSRAYRARIHAAKSPEVRKFLRRMRRRPWRHPIHYWGGQLAVRRFLREHPEAQR